MAEPALEAGQTDKLELKVLVTGVPGSDRLEGFKTFLSEYFIEVGEAPYTEFQASDADGNDVVIFDAQITPSDNSIGLPRRPTLPQNFNRASVVISGAGVSAVENLNPKIDWL